NLFVFPDGSSRRFDIRIQPVPDGVMVLSVDIDERKKLEERALAAERMEALGQLAGGIAHDFGNLLTGILVGVGVVLETLDPASSEAASLRLVHASAERGTQSVRELMDFARGRKVHLSPVALDAALDLALDALSERVAPRVLDIHLDSGAVVLGDAGQIDRIITNLVTNAEHATRSDGRIAVRTRLRGDHAVLVVQDDGAGMSPYVLQRALDPFYTTRGDAGTGLGLATVSALVARMGGSLDLESVQGRGTTVTIDLPVVRERPRSP
ncbi:MAG: hypothetical protein KC656_35615, partial [Myxococcales bacterium]|nr:hypothetical protein [Myxococcales bacterium]